MNLFFIALEVFSLVKMAKWVLWLVLKIHKLFQENFLIKGIIFIVIIQGRKFYELGVGIDLELEHKG